MAKLLGFWVPWRVSNKGRDNATVDSTFYKYLWTSKKWFPPCSKRFLDKVGKVYNVCKAFPPLNLDCVVIELHWPLSFIRLASVNKRKLSYGLLTKALLSLLGFPSYIGVQSSTSTKYQNRDYSHLDTKKASRMAEARLRVRVRVLRKITAG